MAAGSYPPGTSTFSWDGVVQRLREITLGEYEVLIELGRGGMAAVFLAHEYALNRKVALKVMSPGMMMGEGMIDRFYAEAVTQANLVHPHIVAVHAVRREHDLQYFAMQYVPGRSLLQVLRAEQSQHRDLSLQVVRSLLYQIGSALAFAHRRGVIHRDIKPANVMLNVDGDAVVTDFGIAKVTSNTSQTLTGTVVGTAPYMSPEQCYASELTGASDQYSLGILAYELITGDPPFNGNSFAVMQAHTLAPPAPISKRYPDCPPALEAAVMRMLAKKREDRFADVNAALAGLGALAASNDMTDPLRQELIRLADVRAVEASLGDVLRTPLSPMPRTRRPAEGGRPPAPYMPQRPVPTPPAGERVAPPVDSTRIVMLRLSDPPTRLEVGERLQLTVSATNATGENVAVSAVSWSSSNPLVARVVPETGAIEALSAGVADIVSSSGGAVASARIRVYEAIVARIEGPRLTEPLEVDDAVELQAEALDGRGRRLDRRITWSTQDTAVVTVTPAGALTARAPGTAKVVATADGAHAEVGLRVIAPVVTHIALAGVPEILGVGETVRLTVVAHNKHGRVIPAKSVRWSSSAVGILKVSAEGDVTALANGRGTISAESDRALERATVVVGAVPLASLEVGGLPDRIKAGTMRRLRVTSTDIGGRARRLPLTWSSSDESVAVVDDMQTFVAKRPGAAVLRVRCGTIERSFPVLVEAVVPLSEHGRRLWDRIPKRAVAGLVLLGGLAYGAIRILPDLLPTRDEIAQTDTAGGPTAGGATVDTTGATAAGAGGSGGSGGGVDPTRDPGGKAEVTTPALVGTSLSIEHNGAIELETGENRRLRVRPAQDRAQALTVQWSSSDPSIVRSNGTTGTIEARRAGVVTVWASSGEARDSVTVTVSDPRVARLLVEGERALTVGDTTRLRVTIMSTRNRPLPWEGVQWRSSRPDLVSIDSAGRVRAIAGGTAQLSAHFLGVSSLPHSVEIAAATRPVTSSAVETSAQKTDPRPVSPVRPDTPAARATPPPGPDATTLLASAASVAAECREAYVRQNVARIQALGAGGTAAQTTSLNNLLRLFREQSPVRVAATGRESAPEIAGQSATAALQVRLDWVNNIRVPQNQTVSLTAHLERQGDSWQLSHCHIQGSVRAR